MELILMYKKHLDAFVSFVNRHEELQTLNGWFSIGH